MQQLKHIEGSCHYYFFGFIVFFLFSSHSGESIYDPPLLKLILLRSYKK